RASLGARCIGRGCSQGAHVALVVRQMAAPNTPQQPRPPQQTPAPARSPLAGLLPLLLLLIFLFGPYLFGGGRGRRMDYSAFLTNLDSGRVSRVEVSPTEIRGTLRSANPPGDTAFSTLPIEHPELVNELRQHGVVFTGRPQAGLMTSILSWIIP